MTVRSYVRKTLFASLVALAIGGFLLHLRVHPFVPLAKNSAKLVPFISGILSIVVVPVLFAFRKTLSYGYVLNGMLVILGTITMADFSIDMATRPVTLEGVILRSTLADIAILWGKFFVGKALFDLETFGYDATQEKRGVTHRYPNYGWWAVHLGVIALVYYLGQILWR